MGKKITLIIMLVALMLVLIGCDKDKDMKLTTNVATQETDEHGHIHTHLNQESVSSVSKKEKVGVDAIEKIQSFSMKKLGLSGEKKDYHFMVSTEMKEINDSEYFEVIAAVVNESKNKKDVSIDTKAAYYVSKNGKKCLKLDSKTGEYKSLK